MPEIKPVKVFDRTNPCTKVDLHNCFAGEHGYVRRAVVEAQGEIGVNAPKYLLTKGLAVYRTIGSIDYYELTEQGQRWLHEGLAGHLKRHPDDIRKVKIEGASVTPVVRIARTRVKEQ